MANEKKLPAWILENVPDDAVWGETYVIARKEETRSGSRRSLPGGAELFLSLRKPPNHQYDNALLIPHCKDQGLISNIWSLFYDCY